MAFCGIFSIFAHTMHFISEKRRNSKTQREERYYRIKESFRDQTGCVRGRVLLNIGFISEAHTAEDISNISRCLNSMSKHRGELDLFGDAFSDYNEFVRAKVQEYWNRMAEEGKLDTVK